MASGDSIFGWDAQAARPPAANYATLDVRNDHVVLDFDDTNSESADFFGIAPSGVSQAIGQTVILTWATSSATSGNVVWNVEVERHEPDSGFDLDSNAFPVSTSGTTAVPSQSGVLRQTTLVIPLTEIDDLPHAGESFRLRITRDSGSTSDTASGDVELVAVEIRES